MKKRFIVTSFTSYKMLRLLNKARSMVACMTDNKNFTAPTPALADVTSGADAYDVALALPNSKAATLHKEHGAALT